MSLFLRMAYVWEDGMALGIHQSKLFAVFLSMVALSIWPMQASADEGEGGGIIVTEPNIEEAPNQLSPPVIREPAYACSNVVGVDGFVPGATVEIYVNGTPVGSAVLGNPANPSGVPVPQLMDGDVLEATQTYNGATSAKSEKVFVKEYTEDYPDGLPRSRIYPPPLYECGRQTASYEHLPGSNIEVYSSLPGTGNYSTIGNRTAVTNYSLVNVSPDFTEGEAITTTYGFCSDISDMSAEEIVQPQPDPMPAPTVVDEPYEGMTHVEINDVLHGSLVQFYIDGAPDEDYALGVSSREFELSRALAEGEEVTADQTLCETSDSSDPVEVKPCHEMPAPEIRRPEFGDSHVIVTKSVAGARIQVFGGNGNEIGDGGGSRISLTRPIRPNEELLVRQISGECVGQFFYKIGATCKEIDEISDPSFSGRYEVETLDYNVGTTDVLGTESRVAAHVRYPRALGDEGLSSYGGEFPIVFVMHGNHGLWRDPEDPTGGDVCGSEPPPGWTQVLNHRGYDYLLNALARNGFIAVSIDGHDVTCKNYGALDAGYIAERGELILAHIRAWTRFNEGFGRLGELFDGRVDLQDVGLAGHSRGGEAVVYAADRAASRFEPEDATVKSVVSIAPTDIITEDNEFGEGYDELSTLVLGEVPLLMLLPAADGDVQSNAGAKIYDRSYAGENPRWFRSQKYIYGANHNDFNTEWYYDDTNGVNPMSASEQKDLLRAWGRTFFEYTLYSRSRYRDIFTGDAVIPSLTHERVYTSFFDARALLVDEYQNGTAQVNSLGGTVTPNNYSVFSEYEFRQSGNNYNNSFFHDTDGLVTLWEEPASYTSEVGGDVSSFEFLSFRVTLVNDERNLEYRRNPIRLGVGLEDGSGQRSRVETTDIAEIPYPYDHYGTVDKSMMRTVRVPTACLSKTDPERPVDLTDIEFVVFDTGDREQGVVGYDQLSFSN